MWAGSGLLILSARIRQICPPTHGRSGQEQVSTHWDRTKQNCDRCKHLDPNLGKLRSVSPTQLPSSDTDTQTHRITTFPLKSSNRGDGEKLGVYNNGIDSTSKDKNRKRILPPISPSFLFS